MAKLKKSNSDTTAILTTLAIIRGATATVEIKAEIRFTKKFRII